MTTRDRTGLFLRYREQARALHRRPAGTSDGSRFLGAEDTLRDPILQYEDRENENDGAQFRRGGMEPDWAFTYNELECDMSELETLLEQLISLYNKHLLPSFGETDTSQLEHDIRICSHQLTKLLHEVERKVRNVTKQTLELDSDEKEVEIKIRRNMQKRYATPLQELSMSFRKRQKAYLDKLKEQRESFSAKTDSNMETLIDIGDSSATDRYESGFSETQLLTVENATALAENRTRELTRVAENVNDLATLVKDIASLVVDQGTVLDRIDYNLEDVKQTTTSAVRELHIANRYQRKRHALCCIILLSIACGIMFTILVVKWTS